MIGQPRSVRENVSGLVDVLTALEQGQELRAAVRVVVAVAEVGPSRPAVFDAAGVQVPERVDQAVPGGEGSVEVALEPSTRNGPSEVPTMTPVARAGR